MRAVSKAFADGVAARSTTMMVARLKSLALSAFRRCLVIPLLLAFAAVAAYASPTFIDFEQFNDQDQITN